VACNHTKLLDIEFFPLFFGGGKLVTIGTGISPRIIGLVWQLALSVQCIDLIRY
jgi:hypothetical protein